MNRLSHDHIRFFLSYFEKNRSYVSGLSVCSILVALWLSVRMCVVRAKNV